MKKIIFYFPVFVLFIWACNPMEEIYDEINETAVAYHKNVDKIITEYDYGIAKNAALIYAENAEDSLLAKSIATDMSFNTRFTGNDYIPFILEESFQALDEKSSANVTYNTNIGEPEYLNDLSLAPMFEFKAEDYENVGGSVAENGYFSSTSPPEGGVPNILASEYSDATEGDKVLVKYEYVEIAGVSAKKHFSYDFTGLSDRDPIKGIDGWLHELEEGEREWVTREYSNNTYAQFSSYGSEEDNIAYLITPAIDVSSTENHQLSFDVNIGYWTHEGLNILISEDYDESDLNSASWTDITSNFIIPTEPTDGYGTFVTAGTADISSYTGTIYIAFKYTGSDSDENTTTYQIDNIIVKETVESEAVPEEINMFYTYDGSSWKVQDGIYSLNPADYDEMGGPSQTDCFSSGVSPDNYIPQFLAINLPYAQEGKLLAITYDYYADTATIRLADEYFVLAGNWVKQSYIEEKTEQFVHTGETGWIFDPTIRTQLGSSDYQLIVDYVKANISSGYIDSYGTGEFYHGANSHYRNFDLRVSKRDEYATEGFEGLAEEEAIALTWIRVEDALKIYLAEAYPNAAPDVNGVTVFYWLTFYTYENDLAKNNYAGIFKYTNEEGFVRDLDKEDEAVQNEELTEGEVYWNRP